PRRINLLCDRVMLGAYAHGRHVIDIPMIEKAADEVFGRSESLAPDRSRVGVGAGVVLMVAGGLALAALLAFAAYGGWRKFVAPPAVVVGKPAAAAASGAASDAESGTASAASAPASSAIAASGAAPASVGPGASNPASASTPATQSAKAGSAVPASAPSAGASAVAASASAAPLSTAELRAQLKPFARDEKAAWRELAPMWGVTDSDTDACLAATRQQMRCTKFASSLAMVRSLARPGLMTLRDEGGKTTHVVLVGLGDKTATLRADGQTLTVALPTLAKLWQGEFGTIWRMPAGYATAVDEGASGPLVDRLAAQLANLAGEPAPAGKQTMDAALRSKVARFQTAHGLSPLGKAGPTTFMQLNRVTGVDEPRLATDTAN
ncbi:MAG: peptidoglycan-binding domain-containing protein, partial [Caldimonas sp.]